MIALFHILLWHPVVKRSITDTVKSQLWPRLHKTRPYGISSGSSYLPASNIQFGHLQPSL